MVDFAPQVAKLPCNAYDISELNDSSCSKEIKEDGLGVGSVVMIGESYLKIYLRYLSGTSL